MLFPSQHLPSIKIRTTEVDDDRVPCNNCGRKFFQERIEKHESACTTQRKRQVFKAADKRIVDESQKTYGSKKKRAGSP